MNLNLALLPRRLLWGATILATLALLTIIVVQVMTITMTTRPAMLTRWLNGLYVIGAQAIFASIAIAISGYALHATQSEAARARASNPQPSPRTPSFEVATPVPTNLPPALQSAVAAATPRRHRRAD